MNSEAKDDKDKVDCVILGKQAIDDDLGVTGQMLAGLLGCVSLSLSLSLFVF